MAAPRERGLRPSVGQPPKMGYQPALDGVRAVSVIAVLLYHAGFDWMHGGFLGVEVFFVVSGFLITALLLDERERSGSVDLRAFWLRRARRLLPALAMVLVAVGVWAALFGDAQMQSDVRRDYPWAIFYAANWGQIVGGAQYFGNLSPFRHLWSLAVEEQWYLVWPLCFVALGRTRWRIAQRGRFILGCSFAVMVITALLARAPELTDDRANFLYLSTFTRSSGLLLGAGAAFLWRPWRSHRQAVGSAGPVLDLVGAGGALVLLALFATAELVDRSLYRWQLALASLMSMVVVAVVVHPASCYVRRAGEWRPLVEIGKRSYGIYLWAWPVSVVLKAYTGSWPRFIAAMLVTAVLSEACYRYVETPVRQGALGRWRHAERTPEWRTRGPQRHRRRARTAAAAERVLSRRRTVRPGRRWRRRRLRARRRDGRHDRRDRRRCHHAHRRAGRRRDAHVRPRRWRLLPTPPRRRPPWPLPWPRPSLRRCCRATW